MSPLPCTSRYRLSILFLLLLLPGFLASPGWYPLAAEEGGSNFVVEMISPQSFRIQSRQAGPISSSLIGGTGGNQSLITRQENDRTIIEAVVPIGATLHLQVGPHRLRLRMLDRTHYQLDEN